MDRHPSDAPTSRPRSLKHHVFNAVVSSTLLGACLYGYTLLGVRKSPPRIKPPQRPGVVVVTQPLLPHVGPVEISANGVVVPLREIRLATEVAGRVIEQSENLRPGRLVEAGETLIRLDPTQYELELLRLRAQQSQEAAELTTVDVNIENTAEVLKLSEEQVALAKSELARMQTLTKRQAASDAEVDLAKRSELTSRAVLIEQQNRRRELLAQRQLIAEKQSMTKVAIARAQLDLDRTTFKSPIRGRVIVSSVEEQSFVPTGTSFVTIEDISAAEVRCNLTPDQMVWVWNSNAPEPSRDFSLESLDDRVPPVPATIQYRSGLQITQWNAQLERIDGAGIDQATRTYPCLFRVDLPDPLKAEEAGPIRLIRGMFVSVRLQTQPKRQLYQISESAIRPGNRIWLNESGKMRIVSIEVVGRVKNRVVVDAGSLSDAPDVIVSPISDPKDGMIVVAEDASKSLSEKGSDPLRRIKKNNEVDSPPKGQTPFRIGSKDEHSGSRSPG